MHPIFDAVAFFLSPVLISVAAVVWLLLITGIAGRVLLYFQELGHLRVAEAKARFRQHATRLFNR